MKALHYCFAIELLGYKQEYKYLKFSSKGEGSLFIIYLSLRQD